MRPGGGRPAHPPPAGAAPGHDGAPAPRHARTGGGALDGYAVYRLKEKELAGGLPGNLLALQELMAATDEAYRALWRYSLDVDLLAEVRAENRPPDEPLLYLLADARRLRVGVVDGL